MTPIDILNWSEQYRSVAGDGFKAEMIFLSSVAGLEHQAALNHTFESEEWEAFAAFKFPAHYTSDWVYTSPGSSVYDTLQREAVFNIVEQIPPVDEVLYVETDPPHVLAHKVIWSSRFGEFAPLVSQAVIDQLATIAAESQDDEHFGQALYALALCGVDLAPYRARMDAILALDLEPLTYHQILLVVLAQIT